MDTLTNQELDINKHDSVFSGHTIKFYLDHTEIPKVCKDLFNKIRKPTDDSDILSLLDSIFTVNNETRPFYFLTITRTMTEADGAYAESLGITGKRFVENRTKDFVEYFKDQPILTSYDFEQWAITVAGEIQISFEGHERNETERLLRAMKSNCAQCGDEQTRLIVDFIERVIYHCI